MLNSSVAVRVGLDPTRPEGLLFSKQAELPILASHRGADGRSCTDMQTGLSRLGILSHHIRKFGSSGET